MKSASLTKILRPTDIIFDEKQHTYKKPSGELYTGCTTISDAWDKSFFLGPWYAKEMAEFILSKPYDHVTKLDPPAFQKFVLDAKGAAKRKSEQAKIDGTLAHDWIANRIAAKLDPTTKLLLSPESKEALNAINAFVGWAKPLKVQWLASEEVIASDEHRIAGKLDAIAVIDGLTFLVDFKTSGQISPSYLLQCGGYDIMLREMGLQVMGYIIVRIPKDGTPAETLTVTNHTDMEFYRETFLKQREAHKFYVFAETKLKDMNTGKLRVDASAPKTETTPPATGTKVEKKSKPKTNGRSKKAA